MKRWLESPLTLGLAGPMSVLLAWQLPPPGTAQDAAVKPPPRLAYVVGGELDLRSLPADQGAPPLGLLLEGTAVRVHERRDGWMRVSVQGWVPESGLSEQRPAPGQTNAAAGSVEPVRGLRRAERVEVDARVVKKDGKEVLELQLRLVTRSHQPVIPADGELEEPLEFELTVMEARRIAGGRVRGDVLARQTVKADGGSCSWVIELGELSACPPQARVSVRTTLPDDRLLFGSVHELMLKSE